MLITGASKGIGYQTAIKLAQCGHQVFAISRSQDRLEKLANQTVPGRIVSIPMDLSVPSDFSKLAAAMSSTTHLDAVINNAGLLVHTPFFDSSMEEWYQQFEVNLFSVVRLLQYLKPKLGKGSHIVNISSMGGFQGSMKFEGLAAYSSSKGALAILTECLNTEFAPKGISVNCLALGAVQTEMLDKAFPGFTAPVSAVQMAEFITNFVLNAQNMMSGKIIPVSLSNPTN